MRRGVWGWIAISLLVAGCGGGANVAQEREALLAADNEWSQTTKDIDKFMTFFAADASGHYAGSPTLTGTSALREYWGGLMKSPGFSAEWKASKAEVGAGGDLGYTSGAYTLVSGGATEKGKYITVWKKQADGSWKVVEDAGNADSAPGTGGPHVMVPAAKIAWGDAPPNMPPGAKLAVISGDPAGSGPYVVRLQLPANYAVQAHWHPADENVTVLAGTMALGMGDKFDASALGDAGAGSYVSIPAKMNHFAASRAAGATIQIHGMGPFAINYVNPADDPSAQKK